MPGDLEEELLRLVGEVPDPELPVISLAELGVLRGLEVTGPGRVEVALTPTWTACPALEAMAADITRVLTERGMAEVAVRTVLSPPWSTDAISAEGRRKLAEHGMSSIPLKRRLVILGHIIEETDDAERARFLLNVPPPARLAYRLLGKRQFARETAVIRG